MRDGEGTRPVTWRKKIAHMLAIRLLTKGQLQRSLIGCAAVGLASIQPPSRVTWEWIPRTSSPEESIPCQSCLCMKTTELKLLKRRLCVLTGKRCIILWFSTKTKNVKSIQWSHSPSSTCQKCITWYFLSKEFNTVIYAYQILLSWPCVCHTRRRQRVKHISIKHPKQQS